MVELADTRDLKSLDGDIVPVRPRLAAPVESLDAQVAFGAFVLLRLFPALAAGSGLSVLPGLSLDAVRVQGSAFSFILSPAPLLPAAAGAGERGENRGGAS